MNIVTVKPSKRCEICHQADCFDPETNECRRCRNVVAMPRNPRAVRHRDATKDFHPQIERYQRYRQKADKVEGIGGGISIAALVIAFLNFRSAFFVLMPAILGPFLLYRLWLWLRWSRFRCPVCDWHPKKLARYCPCCGGVLTILFSFFEGKCSLCSAVLTFNRGPSSYKAKYCSQCAAFLTDEGV